MNHLDGNQDNFYAQHKQKVDVSEIEQELAKIPLWIKDRYTYPNSNDGYYRRLLEYPILSKLFSEMKIKLNNHVWDEYSDSFYLTISDIKSWYIALDVKFCINFGYKELWYLDDAPGDTSISYRIYYESEQRIL